MFCACPARFFYVVFIRKDILFLKTKLFYAFFIGNIVEIAEKYFIFCMKSVAD